MISGDPEFDSFMSQLIAFLFPIPLSEAHSHVLLPANIEKQSTILVLTVSASPNSSVMEPNVPTPAAKCSQSKCKSPPSVGFNTCERCRQNNTRARKEARARKRESDAEAQEANKRPRPNNTQSGSTEENQQAHDSDDSDAEDNQNVCAAFET
jgi:hypothetical protein